MSRWLKRTVPRRFSGSCSEVWPSNKTAMSITMLLVAPETRPTAAAADLELPTSTSTSKYPGPLQMPQHLQWLSKCYWPFLSPPKQVASPTCHQAAHAPLLHRLDFTHAQVLIRESAVGYEAAPLRHDLANPVSHEWRWLPQNLNYAAGGCSTAGWSVLCSDCGQAATDLLTLESFKSH